MSEISEYRSRTIVRTSLIGIATNVLLAGFKAAVGFFTHSIAVILDAVNNLSDALSSVITILGARLASKRADKAHPLGHGRYEYLSAMLVSALVLYAGATSLIESVRKIFLPETPDYNTVSLVIIAVAVAVKILLGTYVEKKGKEVNSGSLIASGKDARFDAVISFSVLISAVIFLTSGLSLEAYLGVFISVMILRSGFEMMQETLSEILGKRVDGDFVSAVKKTICEDELVEGAYDLILHNYGPDRYIGSVHVSVPDTLTADEIDRMERRIAENVMVKHGILLTGIGIYSVNTKDPLAIEMWKKVAEIVFTHDDIIQMHGFFIDHERKILNADIIIDYDRKDREELFQHIREDIEREFPDYQVFLTLDIDF